MDPYCPVNGICLPYLICAFRAVVHGPSQLFRCAAEPNWLVRQSRTLFDDVARSVRVALASDASDIVAGLKMNARSLAKPSPFTSPPTIGVNGRPDCIRPKNVSATPLYA